MTEQEINFVATRLARDIITDAVVAWYDGKDIEATRELFSMPWKDTIFSTLGICGKTLLKQMEDDRKNGITVDIKALHKQIWGDIKNEKLLSE